jgi:hypothetical protein
MSTANHEVLGTVGDDTEEETQLRKKGKRQAGSSLKYLFVSTC